MNTPNSFNLTHYLLSNGTEANAGFDVPSVVYIVSVLMSFPVNSYVIWLIVTGTGNGLTAEFFILNLSVCEIVLCVETVVIFLTYQFNFLWTIVGFFDGVFVIGHPLFECLICVERYLAVVRPVIFLKFKPLRYRLMCSAVVWVTTVVSGVFNAITLLFVVVEYFIFLILSFVVVFSIKLFCCVAVLRALKQSGPGERGREREEENHMKKRAFHLILIATLSMLIIYSPYIVIIFVFTTENVNTFVCVGKFCFMLAGLVQSVFFLYRVGKLNFIKFQ